MNKTLSELCGLLYTIKQNYSNEIPKANAKMHEVIYDIQQECPDLFTELVFDESGITPYSDDLERILFGLEGGGVLCTPNPEYRIYEIKDDAFLSKKAQDCNKNFDRALTIFKQVVR